MAETTTINWRAIVREKWRGAEIFGTGPYACVVRCESPTAVHLFETSAEAETRRAAFCEGGFCSGKHNVGSLLPFVPAPPTPKRLRNQGLFERE